VYRFVVQDAAECWPNCTAEREAVLCIGLWYSVQLYDGPNCIAYRVALLCIGMWYRVQLNVGLTVQQTVWRFCV